MKYRGVHHLPTCVQMLTIAQPEASGHQRQITTPPHWSMNAVGLTQWLVCDTGGGRFV